MPSGWLGLAQAGWVVAALVALAILVASIPGYVLGAMRGYYPSRVIAGPAGLLLAGDIAVALASFAAALLCLGLAGLLVWRKPGDRMALFVSFYLLLYGITWAGPLDRLDALISGADQFALKANALHGLGFLWGTVGLLALFPTGRFVPSWTRWLVGLVTLSMPLVVYLALQFFQAVPNLSLRWPLAIYPFLTFAAGGYAQVYRYRHVSTPTERQQTKWVVFGLLLWVLLFQAEGLTNPLNWPHGAALPWWTPFGGLYHYLEAGVIPLTLAVAVLRHHLFDIDLLIRRTLVYGSLTAILGAVYAAGVLGAQAVTQALPGQTGQQPVFLVASTLLVAALFSPVRRRLQAVIDQRFYRRKYVAARTLAAFGAELRHEMDLAELSEQLVAVVEETMQPAHVSLWLRPPTTRSPGGPTRPVELMEAWIARRARADSSELAPQRRLDETSSDRENTL
ncbi:MAG TPA: hypothetical protein VGS80_02520 [Ktedonobacterales bacterium]|nr:hypothetical protein [Ktedonobacterales bacterium]